MSSKAAAFIAALLLAAEAAAAPQNGAAAAAATAEEGKSSDDAVKARARSLYERAVRAYAEGKYYDAADLFLEANRVYPSADLVFNIAKAYDKLGNQAGALAHYREYLRRAGSAADPSAAARAKELAAALAQRGVQQLSVLSDPEDALVLLDGKPVGITPWTGETWPGKHRVQLTLAGHEAFETTVEVASHRAEDLSVTLSPVAARPARPAAEQPAAQQRTQPAVAPLTWLALGVGTAAIVEMAHQERAGLSRTGAFFAGAGASAFALGGVLLYVDLRVAPAQRQGAGAAQRAMLGLLKKF